MTEESNGLLAGIDAWVKASIDFGTKLDKMERYFRQLNEGTPVLRRVANSGVAVSGQQLVLNLGTPDAGTYWNVENVVVGGIDFTTSAAGSAGFYAVGGSPAVSPGLGNALDYASTLPNTAFYGLRDIVVQDGESLIIVIFGGSNAQTYVATSSISVYNVRSGGGRGVNVEGV